MTTTLIHQGPAYELSLAIESVRHGHRLRFISLVPTARNPEKQVRFEAFIGLPALTGILARIEGALLGPCASAHPANVVGGSCQDRLTHQQEQQVEEFLDAWWWMSGGATGSAHMWLMAAQRLALKRLLTEELCAGRQLPTGEVEFPFVFWGDKTAVLNAEPVLVRMAEARLGGHGKAGNVGGALVTETLSFSIGEAAHAFHLSFTSRDPGNPKNSSSSFLAHLSRQEVGALGRAIGETLHTGCSSIQVTS